MIISNQKNSSFRTCFRIQKKIFCAFAIFFLTFFAFSEVVSEAIVPTEIFVGDTALIRLTNDFLPFQKISEKCLVRSLTLSSISAAKNEYELLIRIVPWKSGEIKIPPFDLGLLVQKTRESESAFPVQIVEISPFFVKSVLEKTGESAFRPSSPPLLIPGTSFLFVFFAIFVLLILFVFFFTLSKFGAISFVIGKFFENAAMNKNARIAIKNLKKLKKKSLSDLDFAENLQAILRKFLSGFLKKDVFSFSTSELSKEISISGFEKIFSRTDFVRFAKNLPKSEFFDGERNALLEDAIFFVQNAVKSQQTEEK